MRHLLDNRLRVWQNCLVLLSYRLRQTLGPITWQNIFIAKSNGALLEIN